MNLTFGIRAWLGETQVRETQVRRGSAKLGEDPERCQLQFSWVFPADRLTSRGAVPLHSPLRRPRHREAGRREVVVERVVKEVGGGNYLKLTRTNYTEWSLLMKVKLQARGIWDAIELGASDYQEDRMALEAILQAVPPEMMPGYQADSEGGVGGDSSHACWFRPRAEGQGAATEEGI